MIYVLRFITFRLIPARLLFFTRLGVWFQTRIYFRYWCPGSNLTVRECIKRGECGCDNLPR